MLDVESVLDLPDRPGDLAGRAAAAWEAPLTLTTYEPLPPDRFPAYLDRRVYQGSSGRVYPLPFHHQIADEPHQRAWRAVHLENEWLRIVVLPELGGRIHVARERGSGRDFFWTNPVIKPALVGLAGPWVAGGVELNWPQHHRPATYLPVDVEIEEEPDGAVVVWCSDHDPFTRMKGMHGVRLRPDSAVLELTVRLYNRSELPQSFLWWANVAARVDDDYQSFFPHDVKFVADHARRAVTAFPHADRPYYGVDYPARAGEVRTARDGVELTRDRLDWYRNIPVPTSYMCLRSDEEFFGGYDHAARLGFVHVADRALSPGKKQWTWGNAPFGHAWDANLADDGSHYVELMAGVFTDNQPDFAHLAPGETKVFSQFWYPFRDVGPVDRATLDAAVRLERLGTRSGTTARIGVVVPRPLAGIDVTLSAGGRVIATDVVDADPARPALLAHDLLAGTGPLTVTVTHAGRVLVTWDEVAPLVVEPVETREEPDTAEEPPAPEQVGTVEELALIAAHLELYRHATRAPEPYWHEALRRDPGQVDSLVGLARHAYTAGSHERAAEYLERAVDRLTRLHRSPRDTTAIYLLGLVREALGDDVGAYEAYAQAAWSRAWRAPAGYRMARLDARAGRHEQALARLADVRRTEPEHLQALALTVVCHGRLRQHDDAASVLAAARALDPLDAWLRHLDGRPASGDAQTLLDVAIELAGVGEHDAALACLEEAEAREDHRPAGQTAVRPLLGYHRANVLGLAGRAADAAAERARARTIDPTWCFPGRLADAAVLREAADADPGDARARSLLGHWAYAAGRRADALALWRAAVALDPADAVAWRNIGLAAVNHERDLAAARDAYDRACAVAPGDARLLYESDQLAALAGTSPADRLAALLAEGSALDRDDLAVEMLHLMITEGRADQALTVLGRRRLHPWEGGEGQALLAWDRAHTHQALDALADGRAADAVGHVRAALAPPRSLGEARHPLASTAHLHLLLGDALAADADADADDAWHTASAQRGDFVEMSTQEHSEQTFWTVLALRRTGQDDAADELTASLRAYRDRYAAEVPRVDYFATSLPDLLLFEEDPLRARDRRVLVLDAQLALLADNSAAAETLLRRPALAASRHAADLRHAVARRGAELLHGPDQKPADPKELSA
jgi:tetratricopeptide (TPR) repeat protein